MLLSGSTRAWITTATLVMCLGISTGCDSGTPVGRVSGVVSYGGKPLATAEVEFTPIGSGTSSVGFTNQEGEYELQYTLKKKGAILGKHQVSVRSLSFDDRIQAEIRAASIQASLECEVASGSNEFNIDLPVVEIKAARRNRR